MIHPEIKRGLIKPGTESGVALGFVADKFKGYLWRRGDMIFISMIESKIPAHGHFSGLLAEIEDMGFNVHVPNPVPLMQKILTKKGFQGQWTARGPVWSRA